MHVIALVIVMSWPRSTPASSRLGHLAQGNSVFPKTLSILQSEQQSL